MSAEERELCTNEFKALWANMDKAVFQEAYAEWRAAAPADNGDADSSPFRPSWGGGCRATPITNAELHQYLDKYGWPSDEVLRSRPNAEDNTGDNALRDVRASAGYDAWGISRQPRNIDRSMVDRAKFDLCEKGLFNIIEHRLGKAVADSAEAMLLASGPSLAEPGRVHKSCCIVCQV